MQGQAFVFNCVWLQAWACDKAPKFSLDNSWMQPSVLNAISLGNWSLRRADFSLLRTDRADPGVTCFGQTAQMCGKGQQC